MKIILINPDFDEVGSNKSFKGVINIIPPLGIMYTASVLVKNNFEVKIVDAYLEKSRNLCHFLNKENPDIVGISVTTPAFPNTIKIAKMIRKNFPEIIIVVGGPHVTVIPKQTLSSDCFDIGIIGEGEVTFLELVKELSKKKPNLGGVKGLSFKKKGKIFFTGSRPLIKNLDSIPFPARHLVPPLSKYKPTPASYRKLPQGTIITSRGCYSKCAFCDRSIFGHSYRERSVNNVFDEVEELVDKFGVKELKFFDDNFTLNKKRLFKICDEFKKRKVDLGWSCLTRVNLVNKEILIKMKKAGCWQILFGVESGDPAILKSIRKGITLTQSEKAVRLAKKLGFSVRADFIMGLPGENIKTMEKTLQFAKKINPSFASFHKFTPYPGSEIYKNLIKEGYRFDLKKTYGQLNCSDSIYSPKSISKKQLGDFIKKAYKEFYLRPEYMFNRLSEIDSFESLVRELKGFFAILGS
ncbi:MAG: radical SAM protein [Nanoarchaeota archaeon]